MEPQARASGQHEADEIERQGDVARASSPSGLLRTMRLGIVPLALVTTVAVPVVASADSNCGTSNGQTLCVTVANGPLSSDTDVTVTNSPNAGVVIATWLPLGGASTQLIESFAPSPATNDYSFVWPTEKYLDSSGTLRLQAGSTAATPVDVAVALSK